MDQYQEYIAASRYARFVDEKQRRETWAETVNRYVDYIFSRNTVLNSNLNSDYNFAKLEKWFYALDELNRDSEYIPSVAAFYYGQSQNVADCEYIVRYLDKHADFHPEKQWRWYLESVYLAAYRMDNYNLAKPIAEKLIAIKRITRLKKNVLKKVG